MYIWVVGLFSLYLHIELCGCIHVCFPCDGLAPCSGCAIISRVLCFVAQCMFHHVRFFILFLAGGCNRQVCSHSCSIAGGGLKKRADALRQMPDCLVFITCMVNRPSLCCWSPWRSVTYLCFVFFVRFDSLVHTVLPSPKMFNNHQTERNNKGNHNLAITH